jgi:hypothetical protein
VPTSVAETGIGETDLLNLLMKIIFVRALETSSSFADAIKLPPKVVSALIDQAVTGQLLHALGRMGPSGLDDMRYGMTEKGRRWATEALAMSAYAGPAPVSLASYSERVIRQKVTNESVSWSRIGDHNQGATSALPE